MKTPFRAFLILALLAPLTSWANQVIFDDFEDGVINPSLWSANLPFPQSSVTEAGGLLTTTGRGTLATAAGFSGPVIISGTFTLNHIYENFQVCLRTDLSQYNSFWERMGVIVDFHNAYDVVAQGVPGLALAVHMPSGDVTLASSSFILSPNQQYSFEILDTGSTVRLSIDGIERLSANTLYAAGNRIAFFSREFPETSTGLGHLSIIEIPEPSSMTLAGLGALAFAGWFYQVRSPHRGNRFHASMN